MSILISGFPPSLQIRLRNCTPEKNFKLDYVFGFLCHVLDRLCGPVVRVLGYRFGGPGSIPGTTRKNVMDLERGAIRIVSITEELLDRKVTAPV
jgi:hypothetical protein